MENSRLDNIQDFAGEGEFLKLKQLLGNDFSQLEIDIALESATAYSQIEIAKYLVSIGAKYSNNNYQSVYYAVHNNEIEGLKFAISNGVDINVNNGMLLNEGIMTATNTKDNSIVKWLLENNGDPKYLTENSFTILEKYGTEELKKLINIYL